MTPVVVCVPGDLHLTAAGQPNHRAAEWAVDEIERLIKPDLVQFIGDNVQDGTADQYALFRGLTAKLTRPWHALVGDHDAQRDPTAADFRRHVGDPCGSLRLGGFRFLRLNTQEAHPVGLSTTQLDWLSRELAAATAAGERVVIFQHNYPFQIWEDFAGPGIDTWRGMVHGHGVHAVLSGHTHYWQLANDGRNVFAATRSIGDPEGGPPGYTVAYFHGDDFAATFRSVNDRGPLVLVTRPRDALLATRPAHVVRGAADVRARVWSAEPLAQVIVRVESEKPVPLTPVGPLDWSGPLAGDQLGKGVHRLVVRATDAAGAVGEHVVEVAVDSTGRYTAVPGVRPVVTATDFC
ncbi:metallophosphoesterase family protein [Limnoglobus roseus]|uniref:3',5'-cyclic adenosine monophosphate phosphodiesterase CpdA n=1 Tax=Limnoglobus roseus TaxID=2598579 RepID=A0A5C1AHM2_9BACT|nr:metallophosphoesterase [Limnoglobus roseus]QEL17496.1 3',5'-cyclic adenosine monophosphate phosphodiesterase CpdA [Limnoglobus roseus]